MAISIVPQKDEKGNLFIGERGSSFTRAVTLVNPTDRDWTKHNYVLRFGACGPTRLRVWANSLEDALEEAAEWLAENAPGNIMEIWGDEHKRLAKEACEERGITFPEGFDALEDEQKWSICDDAEADLTRTESGFLTSYEWGIDLEDPSRAELDAFLKGE